MKLKYLGCERKEEWNVDLTVGKIYELDGSYILDDVGDLIAMLYYRFEYFEVIA